MLSWCRSLATLRPLEWRSTVFAPCPSSTCGFCPCCTAIVPLKAPVTPGPASFEESVYVVPQAPSIAIDARALRRGGASAHIQGHHACMDPLERLTCSRPLRAARCRVRAGIQKLVGVRVDVVLAATLIHPLLATHSSSRQIPRPRHWYPTTCTHDQLFGQF